MVYTQYKNSNYEILRNVNGDCYIKDIARNKIYYEQNFNFERSNFPLSKTIEWSIKDTVFLILEIGSILLLLYLSYQIFKVGGKAIDFWQRLLAFGFLFINLIGHELGHSLVLRFFGRRRGKYKAKWFYIFPMIMVDTSEAYMLPKFEAVSVCYAGIMTNIYLSSIIYFMFPNKLFLIIPVYNLILFNLLPLGRSKTDGYHIIVNFIMGINDYKFRKSKITYFFDILFYGMVILIIYNMLNYLFK